MEMIEKASVREKPVLQLMKETLCRKERELRSLPPGNDRRLLMVEVRILMDEIEEVMREVRSASA